VLAGRAASGERARYTVGTILSTLGISHEFVSAADVDGAGPLSRGVYLVVGTADGGLMDRICRETAVVVLPDPDLESTAPDSVLPEPRTQNPEPALAPKQFRMLSQPTQGGHLVGIAADLVGLAFKLLARDEEYGVSARDDHDRFLWSGSPLSATDLGPRPLVSEYAHLLLACLLEGCLQTRQPVIRKEFWPHGKPMAGCLTHDVDVVKRGKLGRGVAVRDVRGALSSLVRGRLGRAATQISTIAGTAASDKDPYWSFDRITTMEEARGYRSTYYFMAGNRHPEDAVYSLVEPSIAELMAKLEGSGCEIGLHGSYLSSVDVEMLRSLKAELEGKLGHAVVGHRNHFLRFRAPDSWRAQESVGFAYDATLGFSDREGFRGGHAFPFFPYDLVADRPMGLLEIPLAIMDMSLSKYRKLRGADAEDAMETVLRQTRSVNGLATLLWHNTSFFDPEFPGGGSLYESALDWLAENQCYVAPANEIAGWWKAREAVRLSPLMDGRVGWRMEAPEEIDGLVLRIGLPDAESSLRVGGQVPLALSRDGTDHLLEYGPLPAGFAMDIEYS